jgi:hypothetical protein
MSDRFRNLFFLSIFRSNSVIEFGTQLLKSGMSQLVSEHYGYNASRTVLFSKTDVRIRLDAHIKTIVVLTCGKLIGICFLYLFYAI